MPLYDVYKAYGPNFGWARDYEQAVYFDMDGTLADLFGVPNWEQRLRSFDPDVYRDAKPLVDWQILDDFVDACRKYRCRIGVVSWLAARVVENPDEETIWKMEHFDDESILAKLDWLDAYMPPVDEILIMPYGYEKLDYVDIKQNAILIDDNPRNRNEWVSIEDNRNAFDTYAMGPLLNHIEEMFFNAAKLAQRHPKAFISS